MEGIHGPVLYLLVFCGEAAYVSLTTLRLMFTRKGFQIAPAIVGALEIMLWVVVTGSVVGDITADPMKTAVYCVAFGVGILLGMAVERLLAIGSSEMTVISLAGDMERIALDLRDQGYAVTMINGHSIAGERREVIFVHLRTREIQKAINIIRGISPNAFVTVSDLKDMAMAKTFRPAGRG